MKTTKAHIDIPPADDLRRRLREALREASVLRRLVRVAEHSERLMGKGVARGK